MNEPRTIEEMHERYLASKRRIENAARPPLSRSAPELIPSPCEIEAFHSQLQNARPTAVRIIKQIAKVHGLTHADLVGPARSRRIVRARFEAVVAVHRTYPDRGLPWLGRQFNRDHTTALNALRRMGAWP